MPLTEMRKVIDEEKAKKKVEYKSRKTRIEIILAVPKYPFTLVQKPSLQYMAGSEKTMGGEAMKRHARNNSSLV